MFEPCDLRMNITPVLFLRATILSRKPDREKRRGTCQIMELAREKWNKVKKENEKLERKQ